MKGRQKSPAVLVLLVLLGLVLGSALGRGIGPVDQLWSIEAPGERT